ncbi:MAG: lipid IV(A) 3-deoxy-D-manno-octulosonic acid transferase [Pseudomonadota bacterium]|nr:lipid IV(A) 3-deoxy-D-manno-octulosonic acid transferase [Pseudomonadota bacterium]
MLTQSGRRPMRERLLRQIYSSLWYVALPALPLRLWWRGRLEHGYREHVGERFGRYAAHVPAGPVVWLHAVSLGETNAARPLVMRIRQAFPGATILLTHMTATGRAAGREIADSRTLQAWLPYDVPRCVRAFLAHFRPTVGIVLETELWPNLLHACHARHVPVFLVNARLSARSAARYARIPAIARPMFRGLAGVAAQTVEDAERISILGGAHVIATGNLKFDVEVPSGARELGVLLRRRFGTARAVVLLASSREGEEVLVLEAWRKEAPPHAVLVIVPRHPQRFDGVARLLEASGLRYVRRSDDVDLPSDARIVLGDSMGEMAAYLTAADVVLMGGSYLPFGGQNLIEPIALGKPTVVGPHMFNFAAVTQGAVTAGATVEVADFNQAISVATGLLADAQRCEAMTRAALAFHAAHRGATERVWAWLSGRLEAAITGAPGAPQAGEAISRRVAGSHPRDRRP